MKIDKVLGDLLIYNNDNSEYLTSKKHLRKKRFIKFLDNYICTSPIEYSIIHSFFKCFRIVLIASI